MIRICDNAGKHAVAQALGEILPLIHFVRIERQRKPKHRRGALAIALFVALAMFIAMKYQPLTKAL